MQTADTISKLENQKTKHGFHNIKMGENMNKQFIKTHTHTHTHKPTHIQVAKNQKICSTPF